MRHKLFSGLLILGTLNLVLTVSLATHSLEASNFVSATTSVKDLCSHNILPEYPDEDEDQTLEEFAEEMGAQYGSVYEYEVVNAESLGDRTYQVEENSIVTIEFRLLNLGAMPGTGHSSEIKLRFLLLLDEQQINAATGEEGASYRDILVETGEKEIVKFNIQGLSPGIHDLVMVMVPKYEEIPTIQYGGAGAERLTIVVDEASSKIEARPFIPLSGVGSIEAGDSNPLMAFSLDDTLLWWTYPESMLLLKPAQVFNFNLKTTYLNYHNPDNSVSPSPEKSQFALVLFQDYEQISVTEDYKVLYGEIPEDTAYTQIPVTLTAPTEIGRHDILAVRIDNPGYPMCILGDAPEYTTFESQVKAERVAIDVQP